MYAELHPDAHLEFIECSVFYELREPGLGIRFIDEIERGIELLITQPYIGSELDEQFRSLVLNDFLFSLIYCVEQQKIWIVAVVHQSRRPCYWRERSDR